MGLVEGVGVVEGVVVEGVGVVEGVVGDSVTVWVGGSLDDKGLPHEGAVRCECGCTPARGYTRGVGGGNQEDTPRVGSETVA